MSLGQHRTKHEDLPTTRIRRYCLDCSGGSSKAVKWCTCVDCPLWPYRFGMYPATAARKYGPELLDPAKMPPPEVPLEECRTIYEEGNNGADKAEDK